jgi:hypothetical protein
MLAMWTTSKRRIAMLIKLDIERKEKSGSTMHIHAESDNPSELSEITRIYSGYMPRKKIFGIF